MKISIFGMGYVGTTSAACLMVSGHNIIGIDTNIIKVNYLDKGKSPLIKEKNIEKMLSEGFDKNLLKSSTEINDDVLDSDMIWICVGTPSCYDGSINFSFLDNVVITISKEIKKTKKKPLIVIRSTCLPGTIEKRLIPLIERHSECIVGKDIKLVYHPEFLREGSAVEDFFDPPKIVIGEFNNGDGDLLLDIYKNYDVPLFKLTYSESEMVKYCDNIFHALKITFANEIAMISNSVGIDSRKIAEVYCADKKLNISSTYLFPGFAYGGSCLPKDLRAIVRFASLNCIKVPMLQSLSESNQTQIDNLIYRILKYNPNKVGMIGLSFKPGTDDMRESPYVEVAKSILGEGIELKIYDEFLFLNNLTGSNKKQVDGIFRNLEKLLIPYLDDMLDVDVIIINHSVVNSDRIMEWVKKGIKIIDLVNISGVDKNLNGYEGIYW